MGGDEAAGLPQNLLKQKQKHARRLRSQRSSPCPLHRFCLVCRLSGPGRSQPRSTLVVCLPTAGLIVLRDIASRLGLSAGGIAARVLHSYAGAHAHDCSRPRGLRRCSAVPTLWVNCPSRTLQTGARWPVSGSVGIDLYCRSFVRPRRIILDMDDIDDPNRNSPCCAVTATTAPSPALVLPGAMCRDYTLDTHGHRRVLHHHQPSKGATRRSTKSVLAHERI
jgi:hypothetical protein